MKRLTLLSVKGAFTEWGPGCLLTTLNLTDETENAAAVGVRTGGEWVVLSRHADQETASRQCTEWLSWIMSCPEGALLRWDVEQGRVVDELAPAEDVFEESFLPVPDALVQDVALSVAATQWQKCPECGDALYAFPGETAGGCENPFCPRAVERTEDETEVTRPLLIPNYAPSTEMTGEEAIARAA